ncbi:MAG: RNA 2',3'-cyclic phosphodiesterase [Xanthomonadaceae bacterium]|nr:RNA 2',3'-cyclic phosphodiesterase [Xanthomonadaceae bacterium]MDE1964595.1 RNA 2',3'-cyclic phosphodiesterase [Xanthomonadaceae bacterium]
MPPVPPAPDHGAGLESSPARHRLFFALVPPDAVRARIADAVAGLRAQAGGARWVRTSRYHLTLAFLGEHRVLDASLIARLQARGRATAAAVGPFEWVADRIDCLHARRPPCVLLGASPCEPLQALHLRLREPPPATGDASPFVPHVTLAYLEHALPAAVPLQRALAWPVDAIELLHGEPGRPDYRSLGGWPLGR